MPLTLAPGAEPVPGYTLVAPLGRGGFGEVWKARAPGGFPVALKFVPLDAGHARPELRALDAIREVRHPHLLEVHFAAEASGWLVIATSLCDGSLWDRFLRCRGQGLPGVPADELLAYMAEAARGLDFLHEPRHPDGRGGWVGIQHRDVKPHNLLLVGGAVKVADFGLAKALAGAAGDHTGPMTAAYAAPEMLEGRVSEHSDQYSLALTYCQLRAGRLPFEGEKFQMAYQRLNGEPDLSGLPPEQRPAVARALDRDPGGRWPSCEAFVAALGSAAPGRVGEALPPSPPGGGEVMPPSLRPATDTGTARTLRDGVGRKVGSARRRVAWWAALAGLLVVSAGLGVSVVGKVREEAARQESQNNLKRMGSALPDIWPIDGTTFQPALSPSGGGQPPNGGSTWGPFILPYIEQEGLYQGLPGQPGDPPIKVFKDPSDGSGKEK